MGGAAGTILRDLLLKTNWLDFTPKNEWFRVDSLNGIATPVFPSNWTEYIPWMLLIINFVGVVLATALLAGPLRGHDPNNPTRLLAITGFFGGFTSYSGLFVDLAAVWHASVLGCFLVLFGAVASGVVGAWLGLRLRFR